MAFDPNKYKGFHSSEKVLPVVLLLDVSGSMAGDKIRILYESVNRMIEELDKLSKKQECGFKIAIITFGNEVRVDLRYTAVKDLRGKVTPVNAGGMTPLGKALDLAKDMIDDKTETPGRWYKPAVVLVSDGMPNDQYEGPLQQFIGEGRSAKTQRFSLAIQANLDVLKRFASENDFCMTAENVADIPKAFNFITMSVSTRSASANPNVFAGVSSTNTEGAVSDSTPEFDDDDEFV